MQQGFASVGREIDRGRHAPPTSNLGHCDTRDHRSSSDLAKGVDLSSRDLKQADERVAKLLEQLRRPDRADRRQRRRDVGCAADPRRRSRPQSRSRPRSRPRSTRGEITLDQLMDENYREIAGTDPKQYLTDYVAFTDRVLPPIQDPIQKPDPRIVFCVAWAKGGYLPTHNPNYRQPQGPDPVWNNANCRNRRLFNDRAVKKVAANTKPFLLQTYRRDMGGGNFVLMKDLSSPIVVRGRHWGAFRMGFRQS